MYKSPQKFFAKYVVLTIYDVLRLGKEGWKLTRIFLTSSVWFFAPMMIWKSKSSSVVLFGSWQITLQAKMLWKLFSLPSQPKLRILWNSIHFWMVRVLLSLQSRILQAKVEKTLKGSLDLIPSPSLLVKIQIMSGKVCLRCKGKTMLGVVNKLFVFKSLLTSPSNVLPCYLK